MDLEGVDGEHDEEEGAVDGERGDVDGRRVVSAHSTLQPDDRRHGVADQADKQPQNDHDAVEVDRGRRELLEQQRARVALRHRQVGVDRRHRI